MLGLGEKKEEVLEAMDELRAAGVGVLVLGQYQRPTAKQVEVVEYVEPERFQEYAAVGREKGFLFGGGRSLRPHELPCPGSLAGPEIGPAGTTRKVAGRLSVHREKINGFRFGGAWRRP
jgi:hypothetical protein